MTDDDETIAHLANELRLVARGLQLNLTPLSALQLAGVVQLALRHPRLSGGNRETAERFVAGVRDYFADCPSVLDVLRRGDDPAEDR